MNRSRALALLRGGLIGAAAGMLVALTVAALWRGSAGALSVLVAGVLVVAFFALGQGAQVLAAEGSLRILLTVALGSYFFRIAALGVLLAFYLRFEERLVLFDRSSVILVVLLVTFGWVAGEILVFRRLRIPVYDTEYVPPVEWDDKA